MTINRRSAAARSSLVAICGVAMGLVGPGCQSSQSASDREGAAGAGAPSSGGSQADADRNTLARLVGVWNVQGWSTQNGERHDSSGRAAGAIENRSFLLLDIQGASGELGGDTGRKSGSMLFASEPGMGLTLTAWGDASPSIRRLTGHSSRGEPVLSYEELHAPEGLHRVALTIRFETSDRWTAEIRDSSAAGRPVVASYTFTRQ